MFTLYGPYEGVEVSEAQVAFRPIIKKCATLEEAKSIISRLGNGDRGTIENRGYLILES